MLKKYDGTNWNTASYGKYFSDTEQFTNFPIVIRSLDQSVQAYTIKGDTATSGTPSPSNPITIKGVGEETVNLFNINNAIKDKVYNDYGELANTPALAEEWYASNYIEVEYGTTYIRSSNGEAVGNVYYTYDTNKNFIEKLSSGMGIPFTINNPDVKYITFSLRSTTTPISTYQLNVGSTVLPFEPYGYKVSIVKDSQPLTPVYFSQQLMKYETDEDTLDSSGTVTRKLRKYVFTGEENILIYTSSVTGIGFQLNFAYMLSNSRTKGYCTHFKPIFTPSGSGVDGITFGASNTMIYCTFSAESVTEYNLTDITSIKQWLKNQYDAGTPVTIWYVLNTATTETVIAPSITTTGGTATIDVDTTVKPSEMSLTYNGKHLNKSKKFSVGNNLIPYPYYQSDGTVAGVTWTTYSDGRIVGTGKTTDGVLFKLADSLILSSGTYTISITGTHTGMSLLVRNKDNYTQVARIQGNDTSPVTFTISEEGRYEIYYNVLAYNVNVDIDCYIMLNLGSSPLPYEPYGSWT